jgi:starch synthase
VSEVLPIRILLASSEVVGFSKTGGLADVAGSLPAALAARGHQCAVITPLYRGSRSAAPRPEPTELTFSVPIGPKTVLGRLWQSQLPNSNVPVYLVEQPTYFDRDDPAQGRGLYNETQPDGSRRDYSDNCERYVFFNRAILEAMRLLDFWPEVLHVNDWQSALAPVYMREGISSLSNEKLQQRYKSIRTLITIHNIAFQGVFWHFDMPLTGLPWQLFNDQKLEFYGRLSFLKGGLVYSDLINTVSPTYAREIQTPYYGCGLQGLLTHQSSRLFGIVNGVDYSVWDPHTDRHLPANYSVDSLEPGKPLCKAELQQRMELRVDPRPPLLGVVARLTEQKGVDLIAAAAPAFFAEGAQLVVLGDGEQRFHRAFEQLKIKYPNQLGLKLGFSEPLAHLIEAGSDAFLMPSLYEPSGLNQLYSLRYGTPPIVRSTGGLADTVVDATPASLADDTATGFRFAAFSADALRETVHRALALFRNEPLVWRKIVRNGMRADWSWNRSAAEYEKLYTRLRGTR